MYKTLNIAEIFPSAIKKSQTNLLHIWSQNI